MCNSFSRSGETKAEWLTPCLLIGPAYKHTINGTEVFNSVDRWSTAAIINKPNKSIRRERGRNKNQLSRVIRFVLVVCLLTSSLAWSHVWCILMMVLFFPHVVRYEGIAE